MYIQIHQNKINNQAIPYIRPEDTLKPFPCKDRHLASGQVHGSLQVDIIFLGRNWKMLKAAKKKYKYTPKDLIILRTIIPRWYDIEWNDKTQAHSISRKNQQQRICYWIFRVDDCRCQVLLLRYWN